MTNPSTPIKLTNAELKAAYATLRDEAKAAHDLTSGTFKYETFAQYKNQYNIEWDFAHPNDKDALVPTTATVLNIVTTAIVAASNTKKVTESNTGSKMSLARAIFAAEIAEKGVAGLVRKNILARFIAEAGCTAAGGNTYYNTIRAEHGLVNHKA